MSYLKSPLQSIEIIIDLHYYWRNQEMSNSYSVTFTEGGKSHKIITDEFGLIVSFDNKPALRPYSVHLNIADFYSITKLQ